MLIDVEELWLFSVSPYLKTLSMVASTKLLHLLEVGNFSVVHFSANVVLLSIQWAVWCCLIIIIILLLLLCMY